MIVLLGCQWITTGCVISQLQEDVEITYGEIRNLLQLFVIWVKKANTFGESDPTRQRCLFHRFRLQECKQFPLDFNWGIKGNQINSGRNMMKFKFYYRLTSSRCHANIILRVFVWFGLFLTTDWLNRCYSSQALCFVKAGWGKALTWLTIHCSLCPWSLQGSPIAS